LGKYLNIASIFFLFLLSSSITKQSFTRKRCFGLQRNNGIAAIALLRPNSSRVRAPKQGGSGMRRYQRKEAGSKQDITVFPLQEIMVTGHQI